MWLSRTSTDATFNIKRVSFLWNKLQLQVYQQHMAMSRKYIKKKIISALQKQGPRHKAESRFLELSDLGKHNPEQLDSHPSEHAINGNLD